MNYFLLKTDLVKLECNIQKTNNIFCLNLAGKLIGEPSERPFRYDLTPSEPDSKIGAYFGSCSVMSKRLVATLEAAGVRNMEVFEAEIHDPRQAEPNRDFAMVNMLGLVSMADMEASKATALADVHVFSDLVLDSARDNHWHMFRLAESPIDLLVAEPIAEAIQAGGFQQVKLVPVSQN